MHEAHNTDTPSSTLPEGGASVEKLPIIDANSTSSTFVTTAKLYEEEEDNEDSVALYEPSAPKVKVVLLPLDFNPSKVL